jgi:cell volume regulation protein A
VAVSGAQLSQIHFPEHAAAILIVRHHELIAAKGRTELRPGDHVYIFCRHEDAPYVDLLFGRPIQE